MSDNTKADLRAASMLAGDILAESEDETVAQRVREEQARQQEVRAPSHALGHYLLSELLTMLEKQHGKCLMSEALDAAEAGLLVVRNLDNMVPVVGRKARSTVRYCFPHEFNEWLSGLGVPYRLDVSTASSALSPVEALPGSAAPPVKPAQAAAPAGGRQGLPAPQAAAVFASLTAGSWDGAGWARAFQDPGAWLAQCRVTPGKKGHKPKPSTWCPMGIACALVEGRAGRQEVVPLKTMHARFTIRPELDPWRDEWDRYFMARDAITE